MNSFHRFRDTLYRQFKARYGFLGTGFVPAAVGLLLLTLPLVGCRSDTLKSEIAAMERKYNQVVQEADLTSLESKRLLREMEPLAAELERKKSAARRDTADVDELNTVRLQIDILQKEVDSLTTMVATETKRLAEYTAAHAQP